MSIDLLLADSSGELESQYTEMVQGAEAAVLSLEQELQSLNEISEEILSQGGISRTQAAGLESISPGILPRYAPVNSFTMIPSTTNLRVSIEEIDKKKAGLIVAAVAAISALIYKIWKWISGTAEDTPAKGAAVTAKAEEVVAAETKYEEAAKTLEQETQLKTEVEQQIKKSEELQDNVAYCNEHYTELVRICTTQDKFMSSLEKTVGFLSHAPRQLAGLRREFNDWLDQAKERAIKFQNANRELLGEDGGLSQEAYAKLVAEITHGDGGTGLRTEVMKLGTFLKNAQEDLHPVVTGSSELTGISTIPPAILDFSESKNEFEAFERISDMSKKLAIILNDILTKAEKSAVNPTEAQMKNGDLTKLITNIEQFAKRNDAVTSAVTKNVNLDLVKKLEHTGESARLTYDGLWPKSQETLANYDKHFGKVYLHFTQLIYLTLKIINVTFNANGRFLTHLHSYQRKRLSVVTKFLRSIGVENKNHELAKNIVDQLHSKD